MRRNLFDHYCQLENHITNSLLSVLSDNPNLTKKLFSDLGLPLTAPKFRVLSQRMPIASKHKNSIIDGTIFTEDLRFCIGIENKIVANKVDSNQIRAHIAQLENYNRGWLWIITPDEAIDTRQYRLPRHIGVKHTSWVFLTSKLRQLSSHVSKGHGQILHREFVAFLERMPEMTGFHGFRFDYGFDLELAKNYVKRITPSLTPNILKFYRNCRNSRPTISGTAWDAWYPTNEPQKSVHPGYSIEASCLRCTIVLANGCSKEWKNLSNNLESQPQEFMRLIRRIEKNRPKHSEAVVSFRQRHYPSQKSRPINDAETCIQLHTLLGKRSAKKNDIWFDLIRQIAKTKRHYNYQLEIGYNISFEGNKDLETEKALGIMKKCFHDLMPAYEYLSK